MSPAAARPKAALRKAKNAEYQRRYRTRQHPHNHEIVPRTAVCDAVVAMLLDTGCLGTHEAGAWLGASGPVRAKRNGGKRGTDRGSQKAGPALRFSEHMAGADGEAMFRHACAMGLEGI